MSAIAAIAGIDRFEGAEEVVRRMVEVISFSGSLGTKLRTIGNACLGQNLQLYDRSPADHEGGIFTQQETGLTILLDGELYNTAELSAELGCRDIDELVILEAYLKSGKDCLEKFRGTFSFIVWDSKDSVLFAARDFFGEKPLYYNISPEGTLTIASAVRGILRNGNVPREIDFEAVSHYLYEKAFILPDTPVKSVKSVVNGGWLEWRAGRVETGRYWTPPYFPEKIDDPEYAVRKYRDLLLEAIAKRLPKDSSSPGILYSGGTDSSLILAMMKHITDRKISTFSLIDGMGEEDLEYSRALSERFGTKHAEISISAESLMESLPDLVWTYGTPGVALLHGFLGTREAHAHDVTVAYTGLGVEPTLEPLWYLPYINILEKVFSPFRPLSERSRENIYDFICMILRNSGSKWEAGKHRRAVSILYYYFMYKRGHFRWYSTGLYPDQIKKLFSKRIDKSGWQIAADGYRSVYRDCPVSDPHDINNRVFLSKGLTFNAVPKFESAAAFNNVLMRFPYLDQDLTDFALSVSYDLKYRNGQNKFLVRENCRAFVSDECADLGKKAFKPPFGGWVAGGLWPMIEKVISREAVEKRGIFDYDALWPLYERFRKDPSSLPWADVWAPVTLELWLRMHLDPAPGDTSIPSEIF
ncbi:MAG: hypothetical protein JW746_07120 [Candidatus Krumholzibacteriota bacterium]|nr:hypothetical protein [Candidatus Krumholzibacteriota bacterium]